MNLPRSKAKQKEMGKLGLGNMAPKKRQKEEEERGRQRVEKEESMRKDEGAREGAGGEAEIRPYSVRDSINRKRRGSPEHKIERRKKRIRPKRREKATWIQDKSGGLLSEIINTRRG